MFLPGKCRVLESDKSKSVSSSVMSNSLQPHEQQPARLLCPWNSPDQNTGVSSHSLLQGRKVMTKLNSILKSRDITLPTKVHLIKAMVFPVFTYGCESCTIKKDCGIGEDS